jgi:hypothetical protein
MQSSEFFDTAGARNYLSAHGFRRSLSWFAAAAHRGDGPLFVRPLAGGPRLYPKATLDAFLATVVKPVARSSEARRVAADARRT